MIENKTQHSLTVHAFFVFIGKSIETLFQFLVPIILVRLFSKSDYGIYHKVLFACALLSPLLRFHISDSLFYFFPLKKNCKEKNELLTQTYFQLLLISSVFILIIAIIFPFVKDHIQDQSFIDFVYPILGLIFFTVTSSILENIFILEKKSKLVIGFAAADKSTRTILLLVIVYFYQDIYAAIIALLIHGFLRFVFLSGYLVKHYNLSISHIKLENLKEQWKYVMPMGFGALLGSAGKNADKLLLAWLLTDADFAMYSVGNFSIPFIAVIYISIGNVIMPEISRYSITNEIKKVLNLWKSMVVKNAIITIPIIVFFFIQAELVFAFLFTEEYLPSANVFRVIIMILLVQMLGYGYILRGFAKTKTIFVAKIFRTSISLIAGYFLIKYFGIIGAAFTYLISYSINAFYQLFKAKKLMQVDWKEYLPWADFSKLFVASLLPGLFILVFNKFDFTEIQILIVSSIVYFGLIYIIMDKLNYVEVFGVKKVIGHFKT